MLTEAQWPLCLVAKEPLVGFEQKNLSGAEMSGGVTAAGISR